MYKCKIIAVSWKYSDIVLQIEINNQYLLPVAHFLYADHKDYKLCPPLSSGHMIHIHTQRTDKERRGHRFCALWTIAQIRLTCCALILLMICFHDACYFHSRRVVDLVRLRTYFIYDKSTNGLATSLAWLIMSFEPGLLLRAKHMTYT